MRIDGSGALVAGGASGLGEATARELHARGASVLIADLNADRGQALVDELGSSAQFVRADVSDPDAVAGAVDAAAALPGGLRIAICCAGLGRPEEYAALAVHIVENEMLNGEVIRLDGALRMPPR